jgi:hypothetical protein
MFDAYASWVAAHPLFSAAVQFGLLGTLGDFISHLLRARSARGFGSLIEFIGRMAAWALLGIVIKYGFTGMKGFIEALLTHGFLPAFFGEGIPRAFAISVVTNVLFGPQMMLFHRIEDNVVLRRKGFEGMRTALLSLLWFWIPAHTITFSLPPDFQIGLAAVWSIALGIILGLARPKR